MGQLIPLHEAPSGFLSQPKQMLVRLTGDSKLSVGVNDHLSVCYSPVINCQLLQGEPLLTI